MLFVQYHLLFIAFFIVRCMAFSIINANNVFAILASSIGFTVILHDWVIFCIKTISRLFLANKGCMPVVLTVRILISRLCFFEISRMAGNFSNEEFTFKRLLVYFFIIER
jgi:hypothetical protein